MMNLPDPFTLVVVLLLVGLVPFAVVMMTAFVKVVVVLFLLRNALGLQQTPPNLLLYGIAVVFTAFVLAPIFYEIADILGSQDVSIETAAGWKDAAARAAVPVKGFLTRFAEPEETTFFIQATEQLWPPEMQAEADEQDILILVPAFVVSELTRAFEIGFLIYLPFIAIDLVVSNVLLALGMMMVSPMMISLPIKLLLFVSLDGWSKLMHGLVLTYSG
ncbi:MAG: type III secretion system export apparatus subunit SctR [Geminicoccaceae bacterium]|nr:type III secretion system export apparatus subunit SctR [Geminicoccaceae bacterium]